MNLLETLKKQRPCILFLGQNYLSVEGEKDYFLSKLQQKINSNDNLDYRLFKDLNTQIFGGKDDALRWMQRLCENIGVPEWLISISEIPFASIYTSAVDNIAERAFEQVEWRTISKIYSEKDAKEIQNPLDRINLHFSYLFGSIKGYDSFSYPPLTSNDLRQRKNIARALVLGNNDVTGIGTLLRKDSIGILIIEGYSINDWYNTELLEALALELDEKQIHIFSANDSLTEDEILSALYGKSKLVFYKESFATYLRTAIEQGFEIPVIEQTISTDSFIIGIGKEFKLLKKEDESLKSISKYAVVVNEELFVDSHIAINDRQRYSKFKEFLAARTSLPIWAAYKQGYVFERTFFSKLVDKIEKFTLKKDLQNQPIILFGQSSSGKSVGLGQVAYEFCMAKESKLPIIFIDGKKQRLEAKAIGAINNFCKEIEQLIKQTSDYTPTTLIIWDGNQLLDDEYINLQKNLIEKGRNVLVVGTMYTSPELRKEIASKKYNNYVEAPIDLDDAENDNLVQHFGQFFGEDFIEKVISTINGDRNSRIGSMNFLTLLYRLLPETRDEIKRGLKREVSAQSESHIKNYKPGEGDQTTLGSILSPIFSKLFEQFPINLYSSEIVIDDESLRVIDGVKLSVAAIRQFATLRSIPLSIIVRIYGLQHINSNLLDNLEKNDDFIRVEQDDDNESSLTIRTTEEAKIWLKDTTTPDQEFEILKSIIKNIGSSKKQIDFVIKLLDNMSPQNKDYKEKKYSTKQHFEVFKTLKELRERGTLNSRLIVQESSFIREVVKEDKENKILNRNDSLKYLKEMDNVIEDNLQFERQSRDRYTYLNLLTEKIILNRYKIDNNDEETECINYYYEAVEATTKSRSINPNNFYPVLALFHVTQALFKRENIEKTLRKNALVDILTLFDNVEIEAFDSFNDHIKGQFLEAKVKITEWFGDNELHEEVIQKLREANPGAVHYLEIFKIIDWEYSHGALSENNVKKSKVAYEYLNKEPVIKDIENDSRCLYLKLKFWWQWKTGYRLYAAEENQVLPFNIQDWRYCLEMINKLLGIEDGNFSTPHLDYIRAVCLFHLENYRDEAFQVFKKLENEFSYNSQFIHGRLVNRYIASENSFPMLFKGELADNYNFGIDKEGDVRINGMRQRIKFPLKSFAKQKDYTFNKNDTLQFYIGFSFRYPYAIPTSVEWKSVIGEKKGGKNDK